MTMKDTARDFLKLLKIEEATIYSELSKDEEGVGFVTGIKEFDYYLHQYPSQAANENTTLDFQLLKLGMPRFISLSLEAVEIFKHPIITFRTNQTMAENSLQAITRLGSIEQARIFTHAVFSKECEIEKTDAKSFTLIVPDEIYDMDYHESMVENHYLSLDRQKFSNLFDRLAVNNNTKKSIDRLIDKNLFVYERYHIGYRAHPEIDDWFFAIAYTEIMLQSGFDSFHWSLKFGTVSFQKFMLAVIYFLSLSLKHQAFAEALANKEEDIHLRHILTISCEKEEFRTSFLAAVNHFGQSFEGQPEVTEEEANIIISTLSVKRTTSSVIKKTNLPIPFLVEFSPSAWIRCNAGIQSGGVEYLLESLRIKFPHDYNKNQQTRETSMQVALKRILSEELPHLRYIENLKIKVDRRILTDIDLVAIDENNSEVLMFQLKHQDHYGLDMKQRTSRGKRLLDECSKWIDSVNEWKNSTSDSDIFRTLQLSKKSPKVTFRKIILTRNFAHFLSKMVSDETATYCTWIQMIDSIQRMAENENKTSLFSIFSMLTEFETHRIAEKAVGGTIFNFKLGNLKFSIRPKSSEV